MNNCIKYILNLLIVFSVFGQSNFDSSKNNQKTFNNAVEEYNYGNFEKANKILDNLSETETVEYNEEILLLLMKTKYQLGNWSASKDIGHELLQNNPNTKFKTDALITFGDIYLTEGKPDAAFRTFVNALKVNKKYYRGEIDERIFQTLQFNVSIDDVDELILLEIDEEILQTLLIAKAHIELQNGRTVAGEIILSDLDTKNLSENNREYYLKLKDKLLYSQSAQKSIAVVLPLSGKDAKIGSEFLAGLKQADANKSQYYAEISMLVYDNKSDELETLKIFKTIANNPNIVGTVGPLTHTNAIIASSLLGNNDLPLILPLITSTELGKLSDNIILLNSDLKTRGTLAGQFAAKTLDANTIAVLAPADKWGKELVDAFVTELEFYNKSPVIIEWYSGIPMNLDRQLKSIREKAWELSNFVNYDEQQYDNADSLEYQYSMSDEDSNKNILNSIDVIYMPIHSGHMDYIGAQYPAYNLEAVVLGNDNWTNLDVLRKESIGSHFIGMIALTNFNLHQINSLNNDFNRRNSRYFYQAIDCYNLLNKAIENSNTFNTTVMGSISEIENFSGLFGNYNFLESSDNINTALKFVQFNGANFIDIDLYQLNRY